jgi:hypothetical protein
MKKVSQVNPQVFQTTQDLLIYSILYLYQDQLLLRVENPCGNDESVPLSVRWKETVTQCLVRLQVDHTMRFTDCCQPLFIPVLNGQLLIVLYQYLFM